MKRFELTVGAAADVDRILRAITAESGASRAEAIRQQLLDAIRRLTAQPRIGRRRPELAEGDVRIWPVHSWLVVYRAGHRSLEVLRILDGRRDPATLRQELGDGSGRADAVEERPAVSYASTAGRRELEPFQAAGHEARLCVGDRSAAGAQAS